MATTTIDRSAVGVDDDGTGTVGTVVNVSYVDNSIYQKIDDLLSGARANPLTLGCGLTVTGLLTVTGFGIHPFSGGGNGPMQITLTNSTSGSNAHADYTATAGTTSTALYTFSQGYTDGTYDLHSASALAANGVNGLSIFSAGAIRFYTNGASTSLVNIDSTGLYMGTWPTTASAANAHVANGDYVRLVTSKRAHKYDIEPISVEDARQTVMGLQGVVYRSRVDVDRRQWAGFVADDVAETNAILATFDVAGDPESVTYDRVPAYLTTLVQSHERALRGLLFWATQRGYDARS